MDKLQHLLQQISAENIENHIKNLQGVRQHQQAPQALDAAYDYIWDTMDNMGHILTRHQFYLEGDTFYNILGEHRGKKHPEKRVVVMAHFDTVINSPGADDNASGIAAMLEIARIFKSLTFNKTILYAAVNLEEHYDNSMTPPEICCGSRALAQHAYERNWEIEGVVNFETIAYASDTVIQSAPEMMPIELPPLGNFIAVVGNESSASMVRDYIFAIKNLQIALPHFPVIVPGNGHLLPDTRRSDHAPFWDKGYQAIMLTDTANFRNPHYHQPGDTLDTLNLPFATKVCRAGAALICKMAGLLTI